MRKSIADYLFSPAVRAIQKSLGSSALISKLESMGHWTAELSSNQMSLISDMESFYFGTASKDGEPYIQHRGGPKGFVNVENKSTICFPDFSGNRQYITVGNLSVNSSAFIFFMDYSNRRRLKLWGNAYVQDTSKYLFDTVTQSDVDIRIERVIRFNINAIDENCRKYIKPCYSETQYLQELKQAKEKITELKTKLNRFEQAYK